VLVFRWRCVAVSAGWGIRARVDASGSGERGTGKLMMWNLVSVDGCFEDETPWSLEWFQRGFNEAALAFALDQLRTGDVLVFGRKTYEGMFDYRPGATGDIAELMNTLPKIVFSRARLRDPIGTIRGWLPAIRCGSWLS